MLKVGIFLGGISREREISLASGRTVYDNIDTALFIPIPIFIDSFGNFVILDWKNIYKGTIRDFYPPSDKVSHEFKTWQLYIESLTLSMDEQRDYLHSIGTPISPEEFKKYIDIAFIALHGSFGEDGTLQGLLEWYGIPYTGSNIFLSSFAIDKIIQREITQAFGFHSIDAMYVDYMEWDKKEKKKIHKKAMEAIGLPMIIKSPRQGSSIGVFSLYNADFDMFCQAIDNAFFTHSILKQEWIQYNNAEKIIFIKNLIDIKNGLGIPLIQKTDKEKVFYHPKELLKSIEKHFKEENTPFTLISKERPEKVIIEKYMEGKEFSCLVLNSEENNPIALLPTEIIKYGNFFDYKSKYLAGKSRKQTPIDLPSEDMERIQQTCVDFFKKGNFNTYLRIDGFFTEQKQIYLIDPNTISGMLPASFFFHQAAEVGLNPTQLLTYIILISLKARQQEGKYDFSVRKLYKTLKHQIIQKKQEPSKKIPVAVLFGGLSAERHISLESGRNIYQKLSTSNTYIPIPIFYTEINGVSTFFETPIELIFKDNADDIWETIQKYATRYDNPSIGKTIKEAEPITHNFHPYTLPYPHRMTIAELKERVDFVFIALHGIPGEDGGLQSLLQKHHFKYNGSHSATCRLCIRKDKTNLFLKQQGIKVPFHHILEKEEWHISKNICIEKIESQFPYPFILKPLDDGCSTAVQKVENRNQLSAYCTLLFREQNLKVHSQQFKELKMGENETFPQKSHVMIEEFITKNSAHQIIEITCGLVTHIKNAKIEYEIFPPSEVMAKGACLSLEEKFLAGVGENITPVILTTDKKKNTLYIKKLQDTIEHIARLLDIQGYARIDAFVRIYADEIEFIFIEANTLPGMTPATCIFHQAALNKYTPKKLIEHIIEQGYKS